MNCQNDTRYDKHLGDVEFWSIFCSHALVPCSVFSKFQNGFAVMIIAP